MKPRPSPVSRFRSIARLASGLRAASRRPRRPAGRPGPSRRRRALAAVVAVTVALAVVGGVVLATRSPAGSPPTFTYSDGWTLLELEQHIRAGDVVAITAEPAGAHPAGRLVARTTGGQLVAVDLLVSPGDATAALRGLGYGSLLTDEAARLVPSPAGATDPARVVITWLVPIVVVILLGAMLLRVTARRSQADGAARFTTIMPTTGSTDGGPAPAVGGSTGARLVGLDDVAGCDEAKQELTETIEFLRDPERFRRLGARIPRGVLLYGPPGTGKTLLARAVAAEAGVPFLYASGSEFVEKFVGVGARRVRDLFEQARRHGRAVVFFDEFDAIGKERGGQNGHEEREQTLNQLLVELDGFSSVEDVVVIAATNRIDVLDPAVVRPGRFNRKIHVGLPDVAGRRAILAVHARNKPLAADVDLEAIARRSYGFSGAQLEDLLNESAILAARRGSEAIGAADVHGGWLKVAIGTGRRRSMDERERSIIAAHEVGHAICGWAHGDRRRVEEISLFAHGEALGVTVSSQEDNDLPSESDLRARLIALMGGRAAEELLFHEVTGGAANDFEKANQIALTMVTRWAMGRDPDATEAGTSGRGQLSFLVARNGSMPSEVQAATTRAVRAILDEAYAEACRTLVAEMDRLRRISAYLVEHERLDGETFDDLVEGRLAVPNANAEWRPDRARPRAWDDVPAYLLLRQPGSAAPLVAARPTTASSPPARRSTPSARRPAATRRQRLPGAPTLRRRLRGIAVAALEAAADGLRAPRRAGDAS